MANNFLEENVFKTIVKNTPLISIDLIIENRTGDILLGERINSPAKNTLFVPGGRIFKDETIAEAFNRITGTELGVDQPLSSASYQGVFEHFYKDNFSGDKFSTHYIVIAYKILVDPFQLNLPLVQHDSYCWVPVTNILENPRVHRYTKDYFRQAPKN